MNTKGHELDKIVKTYILSHIDASAYQEQEPADDAEKIHFLYMTFQSEYGWSIPRYGLVGALREWFRGLPSACHIAFYNSDIIQLAEKWGSLPKNASEREQQKILDNYWNLIANKTAQLFRKYGAIQ